MDKHQRTWIKEYSSAHLIKYDRIKGPMKATSSLKLVAFEKFVRPYINFNRLEKKPYECSCENRFYDKAIFRFYQCRETICAARSQTPRFYRGRKMQTVPAAPWQLNWLRNQSWF